MFLNVRSLFNFNQAIKYTIAVIPAKAGIQENAGCKIKFGMTKLFNVGAKLISTLASKADFPLCRHSYNERIKFIDREAFHNPDNCGTHFRHF